MVSLSSTEAEYHALTEAARDVRWLRQLMHELGATQAEPTVIHEDNTQAIGLAKNPEHHARNKHLDVKLHFIRGMIEQGEISVQYISTVNQLADIMTKPLSRQVFTRLRDQILASDRSSTSDGRTLCGP